MKSSTAKKGNSQGVFDIVINYANKNLFKSEEFFTLMFIGMFFSFFYIYATSNDDDLNGGLSRNSFRILMWLSALMAIVSHLTPKKGNKDKQKDSTESKQQNLYKINERVQQSIFNAVRLDEKKRLENLRNRPTTNIRS